MGHISQEIHIQADGVTLNGSLAMYQESNGIVVFVQGIGSGRFSPRHKYIANRLHKANISTLLIGLLTPGERAIVRNRDQQSNLDWLYTRLNTSLDWLTSQKEMTELPIALFGSNLGAAAALKTAADRPQQISALVLWSGRPDLVIDSLPAIKAPTLLVAGKYDVTIVNANRKAAEQFVTKCYLEIMSETGHDLKEPAKLDELAELSCDWFQQHLPNYNDQNK
ncbi:MAG: dienelactone hydrolase family protein [Gammaproteobacteria bacterium]